MTNKAPHILVRQLRIAAGLTRYTLRASFRNMAVALSPRGIRTAFRDSPAMTSISIVLYVHLLSISTFGPRRP